MKKILFILLVAPFISFAQFPWEQESTPTKINDNPCTTYMGKKLTEEIKRKAVKRRTERHERTKYILNKGYENYQSLTNTERHEFDAITRANAAVEISRNRLPRSKTYSARMNEYCIYKCCSWFCWEDNYRD